MVCATSVTKNPAISEMGASQGVDKAMSFDSPPKVTAVSESIHASTSNNRSPQMKSPGGHKPSWWPEEKKSVEYWFESVRNLCLVIHGHLCKLLFRRPNSTLYINNAEDRGVVAVDGKVIRFRITLKLALLVL